MSMALIQELTESVIQRNVTKESDALVKKWQKFGLLEGLQTTKEQHDMARLLENQAGQLLKEATTMAAGDVEGYAAVAFPIVRRVFGQLIANHLVSVQPMSLPSGLIFFLDFTYNQAYHNAGISAGDSIYGGGVVASGILNGVTLTGSASEKGFYNNANGYSQPTGSVVISQADGITGGLTGSFCATGTVGGSDWGGTDASLGDGLVDWDQDLAGKVVAIVTITGSTAAAWRQFDTRNLVAMNDTSLDPAKARLVRRLTKIVSGSSHATAQMPYIGSDTVIRLVYEAVDPTLTKATLKSSHLTGSHTFVFSIKDDFVAGDGLGALQGDPQWGFEALGAGGSGNTSQAFPEIDIKVNSVSITVQTRKLKAKWTPELGQDLNAYHNVDAEVELTSILSETIGLEIDRELLVDLIKGATAGSMYWSRRPGKFVNRLTGEDLTNSLSPPDFTGNVSQWYETLIETINDVSAQIHRKTLRGGATFLVCGPEVANILESTAGWRADVTHDEFKGGSAGAVKVGSITRKWDVWVDPYFPRNLILVGRKGSSFLETGYVYAPYVPLQVTPTIFNPDTFVPTKGVATRYAKKMVRPDLYGLVIVQNLLG